MKKYFKKISALLMAAIMVLSMCTSVFADAGNDKIIGTADDRGKVTVAGVDYEAGVKVSVYPIALAQYGTDDKESFSGYSNEYNVTLENPTAEQLKNAYEQVKDKKDWIDLDYNTGDNTWSKDGLKVGMYLVNVTGAETKLYNFAVVSIKYTSNQTGNGIDEGTLNIEDGAAWVKKSGAPSVDKNIEINDTKVKGNTANINDIVKYVVEVKDIPEYTGAYPMFKVTDTLSTGLTLVVDDEHPITVSVPGEDGNAVTLTKDTDYTLTASDNSVVVDFVLEAEGKLNYTLNSYKGKTATITYYAKVNNGATLNEKHNDNHVVLDYTRDSKVEGNNDKDEKKTYTYTFEIDGKATGTENIITKIAKDKDGKEYALEDAEFTLYTDADCTEKYDNEKTANPKLSDDKGQLQFTGLAEGTYYLKETKAPSGYAINTSVFTIVIKAEINKATGLLEKWTVTVSDAAGKADSTFTVTNTKDGSTVTSEIGETEIQNTQLSSLPSTGGMGTYLFTIVGVVLMACAAGAFFISRRKSSEE